MGNQTSTNNIKTDKNTLKPKSLGQVLDYIATHYILTLDFKSLRKLYDKEYCDKLVILTSDIIERYFTNLEITYLAQRIKAGQEINELAKDKVVFFDKDELTKLDIQNSIKKKRICLSIAKFYIKIAHLFSAIVLTINPIYVYKDAEGNKMKANLFEKDNIPVNAPRDIYKMNICDNRINILQGKQDFSKLSGDDEAIIGPKFCQSNLNDIGSEKTLEDEPGIPELKELYYDDDYDFETGKFRGMSEQAKKDFLRDLKTFYQVFTGNKDVPDSIQGFSDIKLREYSKMPKCQGSDPIFERKFKGKISEKLFTDYANNIKNMIKKTNLGQQELLNIINEIFVYTVDPQTNKKQIRVNPKLTEKSLQDLIVKSRGQIMQLYLTCENDYITGLKIYETIVEQKILDTAQNQIQNLEKMKENLLTKSEMPINIQQNINNNLETQNNNNLETQLNNINSTEIKNNI